MTRVLMMVGALVLLVPSVALAELKEIRQKIFGMD